MIKNTFTLHLKTPASPLITLEEAKKELNVLHNLKDQEINGMVAAASAQINGYNTITSKCFGPQTWVLETRNLQKYNLIPLEGVTSVVKVEFLDEENLEFQEVPNAQWKAITLIEDVIFKFTEDPAFNTLHRIEFQAGEAIPELAKTAVKLRVRQLWTEAPDPTTESAWVRCVEDLSARGC